MDIDDGGISDILERIRIQVRGKQVKWVPPPIKIDEDVESADEIERLFSESGLLIKDGHPVFVYIRDHTVGGDFSKAEDRRKIHFTVCRTLTQMRREGRFDRYRVTNRDDDRYYIDIRKGWYGTKSEEIVVPLHPCQNCLEALKYKCFELSLSRETRRNIVTNFKAKEAFDLLGQHFDIFRRQIGNVRPATRPTGYPASWSELARRIKKDRGYVCEECSVDLKVAPTQLDVHHLDRDKQNIRRANLQVLCTRCHAKEHSHYQVR